jgi:dihydroorotate dehydrogenase electron transfer subunit
MEQQNVEVLWNDRLTPSCYKVGLRAPDSFLTAIPGQFIMLRLDDQMDPLLRRPFSIHQLILSCYTKSLALQHKSSHNCKAVIGSTY